MVATAAEPSTYVDLVTEARAQGLYVATGLRSASSITVLSTLLMLLAAPLIGFGQHGMAWALVSVLVSAVLSVLVTLLLWQARR